MMMRMKCVGYKATMYVQHKTHVQHVAAVKQPVAAVKQRAATVLPQ